MLLALLQFPHSSHIEFGSWGGDGWNARLATDYKGQIPPLLRGKAQSTACCLGLLKGNEQGFFILTHDIISNGSTVKSRLFLHKVTKMLKDQTQTTWKRWQINMKKMACGYHTLPFWHSESPPGPSSDPLDLQKLRAHHSPCWQNHGPMEPDVPRHPAGRKSEGKTSNEGSKGTNECMSGGWTGISAVPLSGTITRLLLIMSRLFPQAC